MTKTVAIGKAPTLPNPKVEAFVSAPAREVNQAPVDDLPFVEAKQRFPIELPLSMHTFLMTYCASRRKSLRDELKPLIEEHARKLGYKPPSQ